MNDNGNTVETYEVIVIGGSYAGLSAAMALGRSLRSVLVVDGGSPCNRQTPHSHNFLTRDGATPAAIAHVAKEQVLAYPTIRFVEDRVTEAGKTNEGVEISTAKGRRFRAARLLLATGLKDLMPAIPGFADCWGISVLHCPYCHGYEVHSRPLAVLANGDTGFEFARLLHQWTKQLTLLTNGPSSLSAPQTAQLQAQQITVSEARIRLLEHSGGHLQNLVFEDGSLLPVPALFARVPFEQHSPLASQLGCRLTEHGLIETDEWKRTSVPGIYAAGDSTTMLRSVAAAVAAGNVAGIALNKELVEADWLSPAYSTDRK